MAWRIFVRDAKRVLRNPVALIVTIAIAFLPGLYAWANIAANWDPYSSSGNLQVAVANEDAGSYSSLTGKVNIGKQLMELISVLQQLKVKSTLNLRGRSAKLLLPSCGRPVPILITVLLQRAMMQSLLLKMR